MRGYVRAGDVTTWVEVDGPPDGDVVLMLQRLGAPTDEWPDALVQALVGAGFRTVRYDYRDCGRSDRTAAVAYTMADLADDAISLLDELDVGAAHLVATSMGGTVAAIATIHHPERVRSLTIVNGGGADDAIPNWTDEFAAVASRSPGTTPAGWADYLVTELRVMSVDPFDEAAARERAHRMVELGWEPGAIKRMLKGTLGGKPDPSGWASITAPTLVVHGTHDRVLILPHGRAIARVVPGAELVVVDGMGHDLQPAFVPTVAETIVEHLRRAPAGSPAAGRDTDGRT